jgi:hypothetical protein
LSDEEHIGFDRLAKRVAKYYMEKGYSKEEAEEIGRRVAGKVFWQKYGKSGGKAIIAWSKRRRE